MTVQSDRVADLASSRAAGSAARRSTSGSLLMLALFFAVTFAAAAIGSRFLPGEWYASISKPSWTPPNWIFAPVWSALYVCMAVSAWRVWRRRSLLYSGLGFWLAQLVLNAMWSWLFFGLHRPGLAVLDIVVLLLAIFGTGIAFLRVDRVAALLLVPYGLWVGFASVLNVAIWQLNR